MFTDDSLDSTVSIEQYLRTQKTTPTVVTKAKRDATAAAATKELKKVEAAIRTAGPSTSGTNPSREEMGSDNLSRILNGMDRETKGP